MRRVLKRWFRLTNRRQSVFRRSRSFQLTKDGKIFVAITLGIGLAAINTGNNLLYLMLGWLLSLIIVSGALSNSCLRGIRVIRTIPKRVHANRPFVVELTVYNAKKRLASYSLVIEDLCEGIPIDNRCFCLKIPEGSSQHATYRHTLIKRGQYTFTGVRISTKFPFGLTVKSRIIPVSNQLIVFPATVPVPLPSLQNQRQGDSPATDLGRYGDFFGLREYRNGDDPHSIHWLSSARCQRFLVREFENESQQYASLVLDNALPESASENQQQALENAICLCASLAKSYLERNYVVRLITRSVLVPYGNGSRQLDNVLCSLACLSMVTDEADFSGPMDTRSAAILVVPQGVTANRRPTQFCHVLEAS